MADGAGADGDPAAAAGEAEWIRVYDSRHNRHYYFNPSTGESQWVRPKGVTVADAPPDVQEKADQALKSKASGDGEGAAATSGPSVAASASASSGGGAGSSADRAARAGADAGSDGKSGRGSARKLRSIAKGMANLLGLRKRHAGKTAAGADGEVTANPLAAAGPGSAGEGGAASASAGAAAAGVEAAPAGGALKRTMSAGEIKPQLKRTRSILKRSSTMHMKRPDRRISFADTRGGELANVVYCDNLHYSQQPSFGEEAAAHGADEDDSNCSVM